MLKKIINQTKRISPVFFNIVLFISCIFFVLIIALYQLFVDENYRFLSFKKFLHSKFLLAILKDPNRDFPGCLDSLNYTIFLKDRDIYYKEFKNGSDKKIYSLENEVLDSGFFVSPNNQMVAFITKSENSIFNLNIFILGKNKIERFAFDSLNKIQIIHWDKDSQKIYLAYQVNAGVWNISFWKEKEFTSLVDGIDFSKEFLTYSIEPIDGFIVYPECQSDCSLVVFNLSEYQKKIIPVVTENNEKKIPEMRFDFFDPSLQKIVYQIPERKEGERTEFIVDFTSYLWHHIYLDLEGGNEIKINGVLKDRDGRKKLIASSDLKKQVYIYDIENIGLKAIDLKPGFKVSNKQISLLQGCLLLEKNEGEFWVEDIKSYELQLLEKGVDYLQLF